MARDDEGNYKEGVDFEWRPMKDSNGKIVKDGKGGAVKTRHFFTKKEKEAMSKPAPKKEAPAAPKSSKRPPQEKMAKQTAGTGGPNRGSRVGMGGATKQAAGTGGGKRSQVTGVKAVKAGDMKDATPVVSKTSAPKRMEQATRKAMTGAGASIQPDGSIKRSTTPIKREAPKAGKKPDPIKDYSYKDWKEMTRAQRKAAGLPLSEIGGQFAFNRFMSGISGEDYTVGAKRLYKKGK